MVEINQPQQAQFVNNNNTANVTTVPVVTANNTALVTDATPKKVVHNNGSEYTAIGMDPNHQTMVMAQQLSRGDMPSNVTIDQAIMTTKQSLERVQPSLDPQGRKLAQDAEMVLDSAQRLLHNKNQDEKLQRFVKEASLAGKTTALQGSMVNQHLQSDPYDTTGLTRNTLENSRDLVLYLIKSSEFRQFWLELAQLLQSIMRDANNIHGQQLRNAISSDVQQGVNVAAANAQNTNTINNSDGYNTDPTLMSSGYNTVYNNNNSFHPVTKNVVSNIAQDLKNGYLGDDQLKQSIQARAEQLLFTLSSHPQYNQAIQNLFLIIDQWNERITQLKANPNIQFQNNHAYNMMIEGLNLLSEFIPRQELENFGNLFWSLYHDLQNDQSAKQFFLELRSYITRSIQNPHELTNEYRQREAQMFINRFRDLYNLEEMRHKGRLQSLVSSLTTMLNYIKYDPDTQSLSNSVGQFARDFVLDEQGRPDIFVTQNSLSEFKRMIVPLLKNSLENVPLPLVEGSSGKYDYRLENLTLNGRDLLPDNFRLKVVNNLHLGATNSTMSKIKMTADNMRFSFPDMRFFFRRNKMPRMENTGIADVAIVGRGLNLKVVWRAFMSENKPVTFELAHVKCFIDRLDINVKQSNHKLLNKVALKIFGNTIKNRISQTIVEKIRDTLLPINNQLNDYFRKEREGHNLRERANVKLHQAYESRQNGTHTSITEKAKVAVGSAVNKLANTADQLRSSDTMTSTSVTSVPTSTMMTSNTTVVSDDYANVDRSDYNTLLTATSGGLVDHQLQQPIPVNATLSEAPTIRRGDGAFRDNGRWHAYWASDSDLSKFNAPIPEDTLSSTSSVTSPTPGLMNATNDSLTSSTL